MKLLLNDQSFSIDINLIEKKTIESALNLVVENIDGGFHARMGGSKEQVKSLISLFLNWEIDKDGIDQVMIISKRQLMFCVQSLNEVCNGIHLENFEAQLGCKEQYAVALLSRIADDYRNNREK